VAAYLEREDWVAIRALVAVYFVLAMESRRVFHLP
jgi:hypothetical protein